MKSIPIINRVYSEDELYDAFENIQEEVYLTMDKTDYGYCRITISEISKQEYEDAQNTNKTI